MEIPYPFAHAFNSKLSVGSTATMAASTKTISHTLTGRVVLVVYNSGTSAVYWGGEDVTTDTGIPIKAGETAIFPLAGYDSEQCVYLVAAAATTVVISELVI